MAFLLCIFVIENVTNWVSANAYYPSQGAHMATIFNQVENDAIYNYMVNQGYNSAYLDLFNEIQKNMAMGHRGSRLLYQLA